MAVRSCGTCGVEQADEGPLPDVCPICADERQYLPPDGRQRWTDLDALVAEGREGVLVDLEPGLHGVAVRPHVAIGQQAILVTTPAGNLLWDPTGYVDDALVARIEAVGGVAAIAASHPHMFGVQLEWSRRFGDAPVYVSSADREWLQRSGDAIRLWDHREEVLPGVVLHRIGGHFPGSAVAHLVGADGRGVLLTGDTSLVVPGGGVAFQRSYPNRIPLSAAVVQRLAERFAALDFDRLRDNFGEVVPSDAHALVQRSAERHIRWVRGDLDDLT